MDVPPSSENLVTPLGSSCGFDISKNLSLNMMNMGGTEGSSDGKIHLPRETTPTLSILGHTLTPFNPTNQTSSPSMSPFSALGNSNQLGRHLGLSSTPMPQPNMNHFQMSHLTQPGSQNQQLMSGLTGSQQNTSPHALMSALNLLQQNIGALQALLPFISQSNVQTGSGMQIQHLQQQQAAASAGVASVISQLAAAAAGILPQMGLHQFQQQQQHQQQQHQQQQHQQQQHQQQQQQVMQLGDLQLGQFLGGTQNLMADVQQNNMGTINLMPQQQTNSGLLANTVAEQHDVNDDNYVETLPEGSYDIVEMDPVEILAEHTHFCEICGKGFKRDANLRMHMRGHGDEYKTPAALSRPDKHMQDPASVRPKRFSCPYVGCKRNKQHRKFQPLKTMLCVKNHYRRSHCPKMLTCSKCNTKKFSVVADLKTHEKHCGCDKWMCSCRTTFSRKDKLLGHLSLFAGHTPAMPLHVMEEGINNSANNAMRNHHNGEQPPISLTEQHSQMSGKTDSDGQSLGQTNSTNFLQQGNNSGANGNLLSGGGLLQGLFTANFLDNGGGQSSMR